MSGKGEKLKEMKTDIAHMPYMMMSVFSGACVLHLLCNHLPYVIIKPVPYCCDIQASCKSYILKVLDTCISFTHHTQTNYNCNYIHS